MTLHQDWWELHQLVITSINTVISHVWTETEAVPWGNVSGHCLPKWNFHEWGGCIPHKHLTLERMVSYSATCMHRAIKLSFATHVCNSFMTKSKWVGQIARMIFHNTFFIFFWLFLHLEMENCYNSWVIYRSSVSVESEGSFLTGFVIYKGYER